MSATGPERGARFTAVMAAIAARLPLGLDRVVSARLIGFAVISSLTFTVDLGLLTGFHGGLRWPLPVAITTAYVLASFLGYTLNRSLNFRSHGAVGPQLAVYAAVVTVNFLAIILGVTTGLAALGLEYQLARLAASGCESVYMYAAMRWLVFRDTTRPARDTAAARDTAGGGAAAGPAPALTARPHEDDAAPGSRS
jgi:putative flippase GtrA